MFGVIYFTHTALAGTCRTLPSNSQTLSRNPTTLTNAHPVGGRSGILGAKEVASVREHVDVLMPT